MVPDFLRIAVRNFVLNVVVLLVRVIDGWRQEKKKGEKNVRSARRGFVAGVVIMYTRSKGKQ